MYQETEGRFADRAAEIVLFDKDGQSLHRTTLDYHVISIQADLELERRRTGYERTTTFKLIILFNQTDGK